MRKLRLKPFVGMLAMMGALTMATGCGKKDTTTEQVTTEATTEAVVENADWEESDKQTLRYVFNNDFGGEVGVCLPAAALTDEARMNIVKTQFNNVTMENEMKPESFLGQNPNIGEDGFPILNFASADTILKEIQKYNDTCTKEEKKIRVRGHVLVWHSQTPEWFFHEDYDASKPYVDSETMLARMDNYIMQVMEHFHGENSEFAGMVYAWDVVNEAINDSDGNIRTDSSWFNVFKNDKFIVQAFVYANKYAPADVKLFYNDYNDTNSTKCDGICRLIEKIKADPNARIDGMGMQGHYDMTTTASAFEESIRKYAQVVDEIQITELDMKSSIDYTGEDVDTEYQKQAHVFKSLYDVVVRLKNEENIPITAIIFWGTDDGNSWLQTSNSVGGSADGSRPQCPLLFDAEYNAKPAFWAFVDPSQLKPAIQEIIALETDDFNAAQTINAQLDDVYIDFTPVWSTEGVKVKMLIRDRSKDDNDAVTVYLDAADSRKEGADIASVTVERNTATSTDAQYEAEVFVEAKDIKAFDTLGFDISITDGDKVLSWNDTKNTQAKSSEYYGKLELKPFVTVSKGTISVDGSIDEAWNNAKELPLTIATAESAPPEATTVGKVLWDEDALYVLMEVTDPNMDVTGSEVHTQDSVEVFIDELNNKATSYDDNDKQYRVNCENQLSFNGSTCVEENITSYVTKTDTGYIVEMAIKWTTVKPENGTVIGFELQINDCKGGSRLGMLNWYDKTNTCYANPSCYGTARLVEEVAE